jgi:hypothetical protein
VSGAIDDCAGCGRPVEYVVRDDDQRHGALAGRGGWRHRPAADDTAEMGRLIEPYERRGTPRPWLHDRCVVGDHGGCSGPAAPQGCECACHQPGGAS